MKPSEALALHRDAARALIARYAVSNPRVFGSVLHGRDQEGSDLDILVDATERTSLFVLGGLQIELEALFGVRVDVRTPGELHGAFREQVRIEAQAL